MRVTKSGQIDLPKTWETAGALPRSCATCCYLKPRSGARKRRPCGPAWTSVPAVSGPIVWAAGTAGTKIFSAECERSRGRRFQLESGKEKEWRPHQDPMTAALAGMRIGTAPNRNRCHRNRSDDSQQLQMETLCEPIASSCELEPRVTPGFIHAFCSSANTGN